VPPKAQTLSRVTSSGGLYQIPLPEGPRHEFKEPWGHIFSKPLVPAGSYLPSRSIPTFGEAPKAEVKGSQDLFEKTTTFPCPGACPTRSPFTRPAPWAGAGSARPQGRPRLDRGISPVGHGPLASSSGGNGIPRHSQGDTTRTRRAHPSENSSVRRRRDVPRQLILAGLGPPPRGGLRTPAKES